MLSFLFRRQIIIFLVPKTFFSPDLTIHYNNVVPSDDVMKFFIRLGLLQKSHISYETNNGKYNISFLNVKSNIIFNKH